ncbi:cysteine rich repeat-containing protein [Aquabacter spiritensis]|uniref:Cysteine rich repeat protein n=1 Tax=Aquabacter spiritensis TaxID=933073 RepID=A0A4R3LZN2_9HYPH|nr:cysteine rich repeat-containing protein [Aquabacter spiritensis]TCT04255.1 cysteine rich repeat protein [Aquabacter spiritensis]
MTRLLFPAGGLLLLAASFVPRAEIAAAPAITPQQMEAVRTACRTDIRRLCAGVQPGEGRIVACMRANADAVSPPCKDVMASLAAARAAQ